MKQKSTLTTLRQISTPTHQIRNAYFLTIQVEAATLQDRINAVIKRKSALDKKGEVLSELEKLKEKRSISDELKNMLNLSQAYSEVLKTTEEIKNCNTNRLFAKQIKRLLTSSEVKKEPKIYSAVVPTTRTKETVKKINSIITGYILDDDISFDQGIVLIDSILKSLENSGADLEFHKRRFEKEHKYLKKAA